VRCLQRRACCSGQWCYRTSAAPTAAAAAATATAAAATTAVAAAATAAAAASVAATTAVTTAAVTAAAVAAAAVAAAAVAAAAVAAAAVAAAAVAAATAVAVAPAAAALCSARDCQQVSLSAYVSAKAQRSQPAVPQGPGSCRHSYWAVHLPRRRRWSSSHLPAARLASAEGVRSRSDTSVLRVLLVVAHMQPATLTSSHHLLWRRRALTGRGPGSQSLRTQFHASVAACP